VCGLTMTDTTQEEGEDGCNWSEGRGLFVIAASANDICHYCPCLSCSSSKGGACVPYTVVCIGRGRQ
jgi:hypothetical protein